MVGCTKCGAADMLRHHEAHWRHSHYNDVIMSASQIISLTIVYSTVYSRCRSNKISKFSANGLCVGNSLVTGEFHAQRASDTEKCFHMMTSSYWWLKEAGWTQAYSWSIIITTQQSVLHEMQPNTSTIITMSIYAVFRWEYSSDGRYYLKL